MRKARSSQVEHAGKNTKIYGKDTTGLVEYNFNSYGFRSTNEYTDWPDILFAGGSISFGIGINETDSYKSIIANNLNYYYWDISYAGTYDNKIIYETIKDYYKIPCKQIVIQWVSDLRNNNSNVYEYIDDINNNFSKAIHLYIDDKENKDDLMENYFNLINPVWIDRSANNTHPGVKTHKGIAKYLQGLLDVS